MLSQGALRTVLTTSVSIAGREPWFPQERPFEIVRGTRLH